jgi:hypothetical protein
MRVLNKVRSCEIRLENFVIQLRNPAILYILEGVINFRDLQKVIYNFPQSFRYNFYVRVVSTSI